MRYIVLSLIIIMFTALVGCSSNGSVVGGAASYSYERIAADGTWVTIEISSARDLGNATLVVTPEGGLVAEGKTVNGSETTDALTDTIRRLLTIFALPP